MKAMSDIEEKNSPSKPPQFSSSPLSDIDVEEPQEPIDTPVSLEDEAKAILKQNDRGSYTAPAGDMYPHQWLWDSCFTAIGLRHLDIDRAQLELASLTRSQWSNGMMPNIIFSSDPQYRTDRNYWRSWINPNSPDNLATSGITQPPMLAEAVWQVGQSLNAAERRSWFKYMLPFIVRYHEWLYNERDPHKEGLVLLLHPWETGLDNTPPWMTELREHLMPGWIRFIRWAHLEPVINIFRRDRRTIPADQRFSTLEILTLFDAQRRLRRKAYDTNKILSHGLFSIEDLSYNCIFIRANERMKDIARVIHQKLPESLLAMTAKTEAALEALWDPYAASYWSRDFITHELLKQPSIATLMPLYAGSITKARAAELVKKLENANVFGPEFPVPSVPLDSTHFDANRYWQGPSWVNTNWLIIDGLKRYGYTEHAAALTESTLEMVSKGGFAEYFNPLTAEPLGAKDFSWTAALVLDLLHRKD